MRELVLCWDDDLLPTLRALCGPDSRVVADHVCDDAAMRREVYLAQPSVVIMDVRFGGQRFVAFDSAFKILHCESMPVIIPVVPKSNENFDAIARALGCPLVVDVSRPAWARSLAVCLDGLHRALCDEQMVEAYVRQQQQALTPH